MAERFLTPQQERFLAEYTNPKSANFGNAYQSALFANYSQTYAENITTEMPDWLLENLGDAKLLAKAEKKLNQALDFEPINDEGKVDSGLLRVQTDVAKFVAERLNKNKYSSRVENTGADGKDLIPSPIVNLNDILDANSNQS